MRTLTRLVTLLLIAAGFGLILYAGYSYIGPDLVFAIEKNLLPGGEDVNAPAPTSATLTLPIPLGQGQPGARIVVPAMHLDAPIEEAQWSNSSRNSLYTDWVLPYHAAGHLANTAQPGEAGKVVISGHNNLVGPNQFGVGLFAGLWDVKTGDLVYLQDAKGRVFAYRVTKSYSLKEEGEPVSVRTQHAQQVLADDGKPRLTLITCWNGPVAPLSGNTYRWIVDADLAGMVDASQIPSTPTP